MATTPIKSIHAAMTAIQSEAPQILASSITIDEAYGKLLAVMNSQQILCMSKIIDHQHVTKSGQHGLVSITTATVEWHFSTPEGSELVSRSVGIVTGTEPNLTNPILMKAYKQASLVSFGIVLPPARQPELAVQVGAPAPAITVPKPPGKLALTEAAKALMEWQQGIETLSIEEPGQWDAHRDKLKALKELKQQDMIDLFDKFRKKGAEYGVAYDETRKMFYLADVPAIS